MTVKANSEKKKKNYMTYSVISVLIIAVILVVLQGNQSPASSTQETEAILIQGTALVTAGKSVVVSTPDGDFSINVPPDAIESGGSLVVVEREPNLFAESAQDLERVWLRPRIVNVVYRNSRNEIINDPVFQQPVELCFLLNENEWARYLRLPQDHQIQYYKETETPKKWVGLKTYANELNRTLCARVDHLTLFALSIQGAPMPVTGQYEIYQP